MKTAVRPVSGAGAEVTEPPPEGDRPPLSDEDPVAACIRHANRYLNEHLKKQPVRHRDCGEEACPHGGEWTRMPRCTARSARRRGSTWRSRRKQCVLEDWEAGSRSARRSGMWHNRPL